MKNLTRYTSDISWIARSLATLVAVAMLVCFATTPAAHAAPRQADCPSAGIYIFTDVNPYSTGKYVDLAAGDYEIDVIGNPYPLDVSYLALGDGTNNPLLVNGFAGDEYYPERHLFSLGSWFPARPNADDPGAPDHAQLRSILDTEIQFIPRGYDMSNFSMTVVVSCN